MEKILTSKGRCIIDRSNNQKKSMKNKQKEFFIHHGKEQY